MFLIEIRYPRQALPEEDRRMLATEITNSIAGGHGDAVAPEETMRRARRMMHVAFVAVDDWHDGDGPWRVGAPPLWMTLTVPESWRSEISSTMDDMLRRAVRTVDARHEWVRTGPDLWINVVGIEDGSIGLDGKASTADDLVAYMTEEFRAKGSDGANVPDGFVIDPMCGMFVKLGPRAITLEHEGATLGFCAEACRATYARREGISLAS